MLSDNFGLFGYGIVAFFIACWLIAFVIYKAKGFDRIEVSAART